MPDPLVVPAWSTTGRQRTSSLARWPAMLLGAVLIAGAGGFSLPGESHAGVPRKREQLRFMWAMAGQESGWDYYARNTSSGAFGKYQIMPFNWPAWSEKYLGDPQADQTPFNQEKVAFGKIRDLYGWLGSWKRVAYWWLTGSSDPREKRWSSYARGYVHNIMRLRKRAPRNGTPMPARTSSVAKRGDWRRAGDKLKLRLGPGRRVWPRGGRVRDGQVLKVRRTHTKPGGTRWLQVLTADGRLGWLKQRATVPTRRPAKPQRWRDVRTRGTASRKDHKADRRQVRPRPR